MNLRIFPSAAAFACLCLTCVMLPAQSLLPPEGMLVIDAARSPRALPFLHAIEAETTLTARPDGVAHQSMVRARVLQGRPDTITLAISGDSRIDSVTGESVASWAVRSESAGETTRRLLEVAIKPVAADQAVPEAVTFEITATSEAATLPYEVSPMLLGEGKSAGFSARVRLRGEGGISPVVLAMDGLMETTAGGTEKIFLATGTPILRLRLAIPGESTAVLLDDARLDLLMENPGDGVTGEITATALVRRAGAALPILRGLATLTALPDDPAVGVRYSGEDGTTSLVFRQPGSYPLRLRLAAPAHVQGAWTRTSFQVPSAVTIPVHLRGWDGKVEFDPAAPVFPMAGDGGFLGHLPADGTLDVRWRVSRLPAGGKLFLNSSAWVDTRVTSGMIRQETRFDIRALQGEFGTLDLAIDGPGEILSVEGGNVANWSVSGPAGGKRMLAVKLGRATRHLTGMVVTSQSPVAGLPAAVAAMRLTPATGESRHVGYLRVSGSGATRVEVKDPRGLMQLAPEQWPGESKEEPARQVFVFRFPTPDYACTLAVDQIVPEISVNQILVYEMGESDRVLTADLELDVRDAPIREWEILVPADHAIAALAGSEIADHVAGGEAGQGLRRLKVLFRQPVIGRHLLSLRLERNQPAAAGPWDLPALVFPGAKVVRGFLGVAATPGFRPEPAKLAGLAETPLAYFPKQSPGLQHAFRLRDEKWSARFAVTALGQNVQADVFHLYTLREGMASGSVLVNFFTVGSPANEWKFHVPADCGNLSIDGQGIRTWRREGDSVIVSLDKPSLGFSTILLTFELALPARAATLAPGTIHPIGVQGERGFIQVVSPIQVHNAITKSEGNLLRLEPGELRAELRLLSTAPTLAVFQYNDRPIQLEMSIDGFDPAETSDQMIDFARLSSTVAWDGQIMTNARWFVKARGRGTLRLRLPEGATLWEVTAAGEAVNARNDNGITLIPLPPQTGPLAPVEVTMRYGQSAAAGGPATLAAPTAEAPTAMGEWIVQPESGRVLVPAGGTALLESGRVPAHGFAGFRSPRRLLSGLAVLALGAIALACLRGHRRLPGIIVGVVAIALSLASALRALPVTRSDEAPLRFVSPVLPAGEAMTVVVKNLLPWQAAMPWTALFLGFSALLFLVAAAATRRRRGGLTGWFRPLGWAMLGTAALSLPQGVSVFFVLLAVLLGTTIFSRTAKKPSSPPATGPAGSTTTTTALLLAGLGLLAGSPARAAAPGHPVVEEVTQEWKVENGRIQATARVGIQAASGQTIVVLSSPATLASFAGDGLRVVKSMAGESLVYLAVADRDGRLTATMNYELRVEDAAIDVAMPTAPAAVQSLRVVFARPGWQAGSASAIQNKAISGLTEQESGNAMVLAPGAATVSLRPLARDPAADPLRFFAEVANLYLPAPGIINGRHHVTIRPTQGQMPALALRVPEKFTVGEVVAPGLTDWNFDPGSRLLALTFSPPPSTPVTIEVVTQMTSGQLPYSAKLSPLHAEGEAGESGMTGLAFAGDAQPDTITPTAMSAMDVADFDRALLEKGQTAEAPLLHQVFRHTGQTGSLGITVLPVQPELKATITQTVSLGEERMVMAADIDVTITRAGIFQLGFTLPPGLEIEAASGDALTHWTETTRGKDRLITLHLAGRTLGQQKFALTLAGAFPGALQTWDVPRLSLLDCPRQTGRLTLLPERGIRIRALDRQNVTQAVANDEKPLQSGGLAFRLLQPDWRLAIAIERLDPWVTARVLQEMTLRDGQSRGRIALRLKVENAAIRTARVRLPALDAEDARGVRATGDGVAEIVPMPGDEGWWELRFQRGVLGELPIEIQFQQKNANNESGLAFPMVVVGDARQSTSYLAIRATGRLEADAPTLPTGWHRADWPAVPEDLQDPTDRSAPALCFRAVEPDGPIPIALRRHEAAEILKLRVENARLVTVLSPFGHALTTVDLAVRAGEKASLRLRLPSGSDLLALTVHGQSAALAREGESLLFHVLPGIDRSAAVPVRFTYATRGTTAGHATLQGPGLNVPIESLDWQVILPDGHRLVRHSGGLILRESGLFSSGNVNLESYLGSVVAKTKSQVEKGSQDLAEGNRWLAEGKSENARAAFSQAAANAALDPASNEDARVQLRKLETQQAVMGLNTLRQRLVLDNAGSPETRPNEQIARAARENPLLQGAQEFDPRQLDQLLQGNSFEETNALNRLADRLVHQQAAATPTLRSLDITLPDSGKIHHFSRGVQVDANAPLSLEIEMSPHPGPRALWPAALLLALLAGLGTLARPRP